MTDAVMGAWTFSYDDFNRLVSGNATAGVDNGLDLGWTYDRGPRRQVFVAGVEDRYGNRGPRGQVFVRGVANRWAQNATRTGTAGATQPQLTFTGNNNHVDGWVYDDAGNSGSPASDFARWGETCSTTAATATPTTPRGGS